MAEMDKQDRWERVRKDNGIDQVFESDPNCQYYTAPGTRVHRDQKARARCERQGNYVVCTVTKAQYIIIEAKTPAGRVRHLYTNLSPEELERRGHL